MGFFIRVFGAVIALQAAQGFKEAGLITAGLLIMSLGTVMDYDKFTTIEEKKYEREDS